MRVSSKDLVLGVFASFLLVVPLSASDHREAPLIAGDPSADLADLYAFVSPEDATKTVLAMTVNPFSVAAEAVNFHFSPDVLYTFHVDRTGDGRGNFLVATTFSEREAGAQTFTVHLPGGATLDGTVTEPTEEPTANPPVIAAGGGVRAFAGPRDDPFFFDVVGFNRLLAGTGGFSGTDGFAGFNVSALVIEIPTAMIGDVGGTLGVWATTSRRRLEQHRAPRRSVSSLKSGFDYNTLRTSGEFKQIDRVGNPAVATVLIPGDRKDLYNATRPRLDEMDWAGTIVGSLDAIADAFGVVPDVATLASVAVSGGDTLKYDPSTVPTSYPFGRAPADDVIDILLSLILRNGDGSPVLPEGDGVNRNRKRFPKTFPFLASPNQPK